MRFKRNRITSTKLYVFQVWLGCFIFQGEKLLLQQSELVPSSVTSRRSARGWRGRQPRESGNMFINCSLKKEKKCLPAWRKVAEETLDATELT